MTLTCPSCAKQNKVAGYYPENPDSVAGASKRTVACGFCGHRWEPKEEKPRMIPSIWRAAEEK